MLAALAKILSSLVLGAGILDRLWETSAYVSIQRFWLSLVSDGEGGLLFTKCSLIEKNLSNYRIQGMTNKTPI